MRGAWLVASLLVVPLLVGPSAAQQDPEPNDGKVTISVNLSPAGMPKPISKFYLVPEYRDSQPGEKIGGFLRCFMEQNVFYNQENSDKRHKWLDMPLKDLPADVREQAGIKAGIAYEPRYATMMVFMDQAARYTRTEWNEWFNVRHDGIYTLLPELQKMRELAYVLRLRMRGEVKNQEFGRAIESVKSQLGLARVCEQHPTLIGNLVAIAIAMQTVQGIEEMIQQPGCPNLFWSFADLPRPTIDLHSGFGGERIFLTAQFGHILKADHAFTEVELQKQLKELDEIINSSDGDAKDKKAKQPKPTARYETWARDKDRVEAARKRLTEYGGFSTELVKSFPPLQVVLTDDLLQYEIYRDELNKWMNLPYPRIAGVKQVEEQLEKAKGDLLLAPLLVPALRNVKRAQVRLDQRIAYLQTIEAIRFYAHENGGKLPTNLSDIKLPLPVDPVTGKPFNYSVKDGVITLTGENPSPDNEKTNRVYSMTFRK